VDVGVEEAAYPLIKVCYFAIKGWGSCILIALNRKSSLDLSVAILDGDVVAMY
jgi:hypothetical protein